MVNNLLIKFIFHIYKLQKHLLNHFIMINILLILSNNLKLLIFYVYKDFLQQNKLYIMIMYSFF